MASNIKPIKYMFLLNAVYSVHNVIVTSYIAAGRLAGENNKISCSIFSYNSSFLLLW